MGAHGGFMGALGCRGTGGQENKRGESTNGESGSCFACVVTTTKKQQRCSDGHSNQRGQRGTMSQKLGVHRVPILT